MSQRYRSPSSGFGSRREVINLPLPGVSDVQFFGERRHVIASIVAGIDLDAGFHVRVEIETLTNVSTDFADLVRKEI